MECQGNPSVLFRLNTDGIVSGRIAAGSDDRFFFGSESGQVYALKATRSGQVLWSRPYAEPFYNDPMIFGEQLLLRSTYGNLYSLGLNDGISTWLQPVPNVDELLAAFDARAYVRLLTGGLAVVDTQSGRLVETIYEALPQRLLVNNQTDRLYLVSNSGAVQCLRPEGKRLPTISSWLQPKADTSSEVESDEGSEAPETMDGDGDDPFDTDPAADPFGVDPAADPFGGDADMADPFGGVDPFGGN
jgi:hypothetical protein